MYSRIYNTYIGKYGSDNLKGVFFQNFASCYRNFKQHKIALEYFIEARRCFENIGSLRIYEVDNNLALCLRDLKLYDKAHYYVDLAIEGFAETGDLVREAFVHDTKALIYIENKLFPHAVYQAQIATEKLRKLEEFAIYTESLITKFTAEFNTDDVLSALQTYTTAMDTARHLSSEIAAKVHRSFALLITESQSKNNEFEFEVPAESSDLIQINDTDFVVVDNQRPVSGDKVIINYNNVIYFGSFFRDDILKFITLEMESGPPLVIGIEEKYSSKKVIGFCRKINNYKFTTVS